MLKKYEQLTETQKESAQELRPNDYREWFYKTRGVEIEFAAKLRETK